MADRHPQVILLVTMLRFFAVTGTSFVVFSGSMKESYGTAAKCSIVEDGIMVQITKEALDDFKTKLNNMQVRM